MAVVEDVLSATAFEEATQASTLVSAKVHLTTLQQSSIQGLLMPALLPALRPAVKANLCLRLLLAKARPANAVNEVSTSAPGGRGLLGSLVRAVQSAGRGVCAVGR